jgi:hypothetical protein
VGVAVLLLIAAATTGLPGPGTAAPSLAWAAAAIVAAAGALTFVIHPLAASRLRNRNAEPSRPADADCQR